MTICRSPSSRTLGVDRLVCPRATVLVIPLTLLCVRVASAAIVAYTDEAEWKAATPVVTTIQFSDLPPWTFVSDQYSAMGVTFTPGDDYIQPGANTFPSDGFGLAGGFTQQGFVLPIIMEFEAPITSLAIRYPGAAKFILYSNGVQIGETNQFLGFNPWSFAGLVSDTPFDKVVLQNTVGSNTMDTLFFGAPVPGPAGVFVVALGGIATATRGRRRRG